MHESHGGDAVAFVGGGRKKYGGVGGRVERRGERAATGENLGEDNREV